MKLGVISDVHADVHALKAALEHMARLGCDEVICAGDLVDYGLFPEETLQLMRSEKIPCVRGNHDRWAVKDGRDTTGWDLTPDSMVYLERLPLYIIKMVNYVRIAVWHARPGDDMEGIYPDAIEAAVRKALDDARHDVHDNEGVDVLIVGHTHEPLCRQTATGRMIVNPGALLRAPADPDAVKAGGTFGVLELPSKKWTVHHI